MVEGKVVIGTTLVVLATIFVFDGIGDGLTSILRRHSDMRQCADIASWGDICLNVLSFTGFVDEV